MKMITVSHKGTTFQSLNVVCLAISFNTNGRGVGRRVEKDVNLICARCMLDTQECDLQYGE